MTEQDPTQPEAVQHPTPQAVADQVMEDLSTSLTRNDIRALAAHGPLVVKVRRGDDVASVIGKAVADAIAEHRPEPKAQPPAAVPDDITEPRQRAAYALGHLTVDQADAFMDRVPSPHDLPGGITSDLAAAIGSILEPFALVGIGSSLVNTTLERSEGRTLSPEAAALREQLLGARQQLIDSAALGVAKAIDGLADDLLYEVADHLTPGWRA